MLRKLLALAVVSAAPCGVLVGQESADQGVSPEQLYWRHSDGKPSRATGLLYRPELLSVLIAGRPPEAVPHRILRAVEQQTPIVVMWRIPLVASQGEPVGPSRMFVLDTTTGHTVAPVWETSDARDVRIIDSRTPFQEIGAVAAFPQSAFQPGRVLVLFAPLPDNPATGGHRGVQAFGEFQETRARPK